MRGEYLTQVCKALRYVVIMLFFLSIFQGVNVEAGSYSMKAPETFKSIKLPQDERYTYNPFYNFSLTLEGWACGEKYSETTIYRIREMNRLIQPLAEAEKTLADLEKVIVQMGREKLITLTKINVENVVNKAIRDSINRHGFSSENSITSSAEYMINESTEIGKSGIARAFGYQNDEDIFKTVQYGTPSGIWKISKMEPDDPPSVVFVAQSCYQKADLEAMVNAIVSTAKKLEEVLKNYNDTKKKILALGK